MAVDFYRMRVLRILVTNFLSYTRRAYALFTYKIEQTLIFSKKIVRALVWRLGIHLHNSAPHLHNAIILI